jgi:hypothetical protein
VERSLKNSWFLMRMNVSNEFHKNCGKNSFCMRREKVKRIKEASY